MKKIFSSLLIFTMGFSLFFSSIDKNAIASAEEAPRFEAVNITDTTATLEWEPIDGAVSYSVHIFGTKLFDFTADKFSHVVTGLVPNTVQEVTLYYRDAANETFEIEHEFTTAPLTLAAPDNMRTLNVTESSAEIHWDNNPFVIRYEVEVDGEFAGGVDESPYLISDLAANTTYNVKVYASYGQQYSNAAEIQFTTAGGAWPEATEVNFRAANVTATTATLVWNEIPAANQYHLAYGEDFEQITTATSLELTSLTPNTEYTFSLIASNSTAASSEYKYTFTTALASPEDLRATAGDAEVSLVWNTATGAGNTYNVKRSIASGGAYAIIAEKVAATTYRDTTAVNGTTYYYVVTAVNQESESVNSNEVSAQPVAAVVIPAPPVTGNDSTNPSDGNSSMVIVPTSLVTENSSSNPTTDNNSPIILTVTSSVEQSAEGTSVSKITVDPADLQKALDSIKSASGTPKILIQVPGTEEATNIQLNATAVASIQAQVPSTVITVQYDTVTYDLPAEVLDIPSIAQELGAEEKDININITIDKVSGTTAAAIEHAAEQSGLQPISEAVDFNVTAESNRNIIELNDFGNNYVLRSIGLIPQPTNSNLTGVIYNPTLGTFSFVPSTFQNNDGEIIATLKRNSNSIYTVVQFTKTFEDLNGHWAKADIEVLASKLVVKGILEDRFEPENKITRAEFATLLVRAMGLSEVDTSQFVDVTSTDWFMGSVNAAAKAGFLDAVDDNNFVPNAYVTREQMAVMITRAMSFAGKKTTSDDTGLSIFTDSSFISDWAKEAVAQSVNAGIIYGTTTTTFSPKEKVSRAEATVMLKRMLQVIQFIN